MLEDSESYQRQTVGPELPIQSKTKKMITPRAPFLCPYHTEKHTTLHSYLCHYEVKTVEIHFHHR